MKRISGTINGAPRFAGARQRSISFASGSVRDIELLTFSVADRWDDTLKACSTVKAKIEKERKEADGSRRVDGAPPRLNNDAGRIDNNGVGGNGSAERAARLDYVTRLCNQATPLKTHLSTQACFKSSCSL